MPLVFRHVDELTRAKAQDDIGTLYLFWDNDERYGVGGLAGELRGEPNGHGIRTCFSPRNNSQSYWSDDNLANCRKKIDHDFQFVEQWLEAGRDVVLPNRFWDGGTGLLAQKAPKVRQYLLEKVNDLIHKFGIKD